MFFQHICQVRKLKTYTESKTNCQSLIIKYLKYLWVIIYNPKILMTVIKYEERTVKKS